MKTFYWLPQEGMSVTSSPSVITVKLGDGYEQRRPGGLNQNLKVFQPVFRAGTCGEYQSIENFLSEHGGYKSFLWRAPSLNRIIRVVCREWRVTENVGYSDFSCKFEQVVN